MLQEVVKNKNIYLFSFIVSFVSVLIAAWLGIFTRPLSHFAFFWPANAILLGLLICFPNFRNVATFLGSFFAYLLADLSTGSSLVISLVLTIGNYISVGLSLILFLYFKNYSSCSKLSCYRHICPYFFSLVIASGLSSLFVVLVLPYVPDNFLNANSFLDSLLNWWSAELFNYATVLPILTSFPKHKVDYTSTQNWNLTKIIYLSLPLVFIIISMILTLQFFSYSALLYPLLALVWAANVYRFFTLTLICSVLGLTLYHSLSTLNFYIESNYVLHPMISIRIGLLIIIVCALIVGIIHTYHRRLYEEINYLTHFDRLTHAMNRQSFLKACQRLIKSKRQYPLSFVKIEIDQLQKIHDQYGSVTVDQVLENFSKIIRKKLRSEDLFCRIGNDEFMLLMQKLSLAEVVVIAQRIQAEIKNIDVQTEENKYVNITISLGISHCQVTEQIHIEQAISYADKALHQAKMQGNNQLNIHKNIVSAL